MKIIYILGLEHSATTLTDYLLSSADGALGVGEVANFFSEPHMSQYHRKWGSYDDAYLCSCGSMIEQCSFWAPVCKVSGLTGQGSLINQYSSLTDSAISVSGKNVTIIDSSKTIKGFENWVSCASSLGISAEKISIIFAFKDPRSFTASLCRKDNRRSLIRIIQHFNYWVGANLKLLEDAKSKKVNISFSSYEKLCSNPKESLAKLTDEVVNENNDMELAKHNNSHIGIGNKSFVMRNRKRIRYDDSWKSSLMIRLVYTLHWPARKLIKDLEKQT